MFYGFPVFAVAFALVRAGLRRFRPQEPHPKRWALLTAGLATPLLCWAGVYLALFLISYYPHRSFNPSGWAFSPDTRYEMVDELRDSRGLIGLDAAQVSALLGKPYYQQATSWEYSLGMQPGFSIDGEGLQLEFQDGKVVRTSTHQN
ncbi:hypothetical protein [Hymenobacter rubripertinctus]|uniref:hypothetical protein n=1 Tax=Hymenobacter rubripertinctus TaxID=2029981 RepID=UPI0036D3F6D8